MEVTTEEAQTVLLQGMEGAQYITIQRADGEPLGKGVPLLTLNGELISEGMVVDMINAEVGTDYAAATHYYAEDDLYQHELTEEDRRLAAALVAVQLQQQQKSQLHTQTQTEDVALSNVAQLQTLSTVNAYAIEAVTEANATSVYPTLQPFKRVTSNVKQEQQFINVKDEYDLDISAESSEDATQTSGPKKFLPHKKRIARKLKQETKKKRSAKKDNSKTNAVDTTKADTSGETQPTFKCEICGGRLSGQLKFFEHLKVHYEPVKQETRIAQAVNTNISFTGLDSTVMDEFSEPEDLMEGIRGVVERTGANTDDDETDTPLTSVNGPSLWTITDVIGNVNTKDLTKSPAINDQNSPKKEKTDIPETTKKKKPVRPRRSNDELSCSQCGRTFHHKNSLVYHMRSHSGERPHQCEVCGKSFFAASALKVHKRLHSGDKPYKCEECGRHFRQWGDLKYHSTSIHSEQKQYQCEYCGKDFARKYSLIVHRRIHTGEKNYRCEYCNKTFRASSYLQNHRRIHTGEKPHPCTICGKPFRVRSDMKRHMHTHSKTPHTRSSRSLPARVNPAKSLLEDEGEEEELSKDRSQGKTIQDLVRELKLEVDATGVVEIVPPDDNPESILPHAGGQSLEFNVATQTDTNPERDPLEAVVRTDNMQYFFM